MYALGEPVGRFHSSYTDERCPEFALGSGFSAIVVISEGHFHTKMCAVPCEGPGAVFKLAHHLDGGLDV